MNAFRYLALAAGIVVLLLGAMPVQAQSNPVASALEAGYRNVYNLQFDQAHRAFAEWQGQHPDDPMGPVSDAAVYLFAECDRLHILEAQFLPDDKKSDKPSQLTPDPLVKTQFEAALEKTRTLVETKLAKDPNDTTAIFARVLMDGLHGDYLALVENQDRDALKYLKQSRALAETLIATNPDNYDAYLPIGVENYMTSLKSSAVRWFLRAGGAQTDKATGLRNLKLVSEKGHYLAPFAQVFLVIAALHDHNKPKALELMESLAQQFPDNHVYSRELAQLRQAAGVTVATGASGTAVAQPGP
ncbi:MAG TPA: hypothetical protein VLA83_12810 [Candidatus Binatia bacterium]|nr:hypothetical protein [Candidatus Binatia bacterium]